MVTLSTTDGLPRHTKDSLTVYLLGPGFGESAVVLLPRGKTMVVDCCGDRTAGLLVELGIRQIDLLVVSHPDLDHIRGVAALCKHFSPKRVWRYPAGGLVRELLAGWVRLLPDQRKLAEVSDAHATLEELQIEGRAVEAATGTRSFTDDQAGYRITSIAPTMCDVALARKSIRSLVTSDADELVLADWVEGFLAGERHLPDRPNLVSLAVSIRWHGVTLVFGADVENGSDKYPSSGWKGVIQDLREEGLVELVQGVDFVKVAHHGSVGAFYEDAWSLHSRRYGGKSKPIAVLAPFSPGKGLPDSETLSSVRPHASHLGITANARECFERSERTGWSPIETNALATDDENLIAVRFRSGGQRVLSAARGARFFS